MNLFTSIFKSLWWFGLGCLTVIIMAEIILQILPVKTGFERVSEQPDNTPIFWTPHQKFTYSVGWRLDNPRESRMNNVGYHAPFDYEENAEAIIVIGDSYVENQMNDYEDSFMGLLDENTSLPVYNFGLSGGQLADYLAIMQHTYTTYKPQSYIFTLTEGDVASSTSPYQAGHYYIEDSQLKQKPFSAGNATLRNIIKNSALARYLFLNLKIQTKFSKLKNLFIQQDNNNPVDEDHQTQLLENYRFFELAVCAFAKDKQVPVTILIFDSGVSDKQNCPDIRYISPFQVFDDYKSRNPFSKLTHEPYDAHWNENAHRLIYEAIR